MLSASKRIPGLDGLRGISILLVIVSHLTGIAQAAFGVEVFFVISGFIITWLLLGEQRIDIGAFYRRRAFRILPPVIFYLAVVATLGALTFEDVTASLFFYKNYTSGAPQIGHFWSLSIEEQFYLVWPLSLVLVRSSNKRLAMAATLVLVAPIWRQINYSLYTASALNLMRTDFRCDAILTGCLLALARRDVRFDGALRDPRAGSNLMMAITVATIAFTLSDLGARVPGYLAFSFMTIRNVGVALVINRTLDRSPRLLASPPLTFVGKISFSLYLWQQLFCFHGATPFPLNLICAVAMALVSYYFIEKPFRSFASRSFPAPSTLPRRASPPDATYSARGRT